VRWEERNQRINAREVRDLEGRETTREKRESDTKRRRQNLKSNTKKENWTSQSIEKRDGSKTALEEKWDEKG